MSGLTKSAKRWYDESSKVVRRPLFGRIYMVLSLAVLFFTTLLWSILGAKLQSGNADQLVNPYLFDNFQTLRGASIPGAHTLLLKWPLFLLIKSFGYSDNAFLTITVICVLSTLAILALTLYWIERRPLVYGTLCLALSSVLLMVPATPYASLLPVNMAMLSTRNLEYGLYIGSLILVLRAQRLRQPGFWLGIIGLGLLIASDKLFFSLSLGGALLTLLFYAWRKNWRWVSLSINWLLGGVLAAAAATGGLWLISSIKFAGIASLAGTSPYEFIHSFHDLLLGVFYAVFGLLTNFGANPAFDSVVVKNFPHAAAARLTSLGGPAFIINLAVLVLAIWAAWRLVTVNPRAKKPKTVKIDTPIRLSIALLASSLVAFAAFVFAKHYYAVDARYLTIALFTLFITAATYGRSLRLKDTTLALGGLVLLIAVLLGAVTTVRNYDAGKAAQSDLKSRDTLVAQALSHHPVKILVGDYWRVVPIKQLTAGGQLNVMPLATCSEPREILSSSIWQPDLHKNNFAYLLSLDRSRTDFPRCSLDQTLANYGRPNSTVLIAGNISQPEELLLFYDRGQNLSAAKAPLTKTPATALPIGLDELPNTTCPVPSTVDIVAHQDDDLLFMNPDILHDIKAGDCVRTIYITAGDAGAGQFYWLSRQQGSEAAYSKMLGINDIWIDRIARVNDHEFITVSNPRGNPRVSLIFMHLPDGNLHGEGFRQTHFQSLEKLDTGKIEAIDSVDSQSSYTATELSSALEQLLSTFKATEIRTQANFTGGDVPDHSDHMATGRFAKKAYRQYEALQYDDKVVIPISYYIGYPIVRMPENVSASDLQQKIAAFFTYASYDEGVCQSLDQCTNSRAVYSRFFARQYTSDN